MNWRREDYGYAAVTVAALAFVAYLIAGNFGLVPSPLSGARADALPQPDVATLTTVTQAQSTGQPLPVPAVAPAPNRSTRPVKNRRPTFAAPSVAISTKSGTTVSVMGPQLVAGTASTPAGARAVAVTFVPSAGSPTKVNASLGCNSSRTKCNWTARVPDAAGNYTVTATVSDRPGKLGRSGSITITVVNPGGVIGGVTKQATGTAQDTGRGAGVVDAVNNLFGSFHL
jgi:hypothetical protein